MINIFTPPLSIEKCKKLSTPMLLILYKKYRYHRHIGRFDSHCDPSEVRPELQNPNDSAVIYFDAIKEILDSRENVV